MPYRPAEQTLIGCVWLPRFAIQVERSRDRSLTTLPLALLNSGRPPVVTACSREAQAAGIRVGMALREAMAAAPRVVLRTADPGSYEHVFSQTLSFLEGISPVVEPAAPGCAFLNLEGLIGSQRGAGVYRNARALAAALERVIREPWIGRFGIGRGKFVAWTAARAGGSGGSSANKNGSPGFSISPSGRTCWVLDPESYLRPLPVHFLPVNLEMRRKLALFKINTLGELGDLPLHAVVAQFGKEGRRAWSLAHGQDEEAVFPRQAPPTVVEILQFADSENTLAGIIAATQQLLDRALKRPEQRGLGVRQVRLDMKLENGHTWSATITLRQPGARLETVFPPLRFRLERDYPTNPVESITLTLTATVRSPGGQGVLFPEPQRERQMRLTEAMSHLRVQMGQVPVSRIVEVEPWSRIPERRHQLLSCEPEE